MRVKNLITLFFIIPFSLFLNFANGKIVERKVVLALSGTIGKGSLNNPGPEMMGWNSICIDKKNLYLYDSKGKFPFYAMDLYRMELIGFGSWGSGPGEINMGLPIIMSQSEKYLFVYIPFEMRLLIYDKKEFKIKDEIKIPEFQVGSPFYMVNDDFGIYVDMGLEKISDAFAISYRLEGKKFKKTRLKFAPYYILPTQFGIFKKNQTLKKGVFHIDSDGNIYFASYLSSLIMGFNFEKVGMMKMYIKDEPRKIPLPNVQIEKKGGIVTADPEKFTQCYLSLTSDDKNLYALFSGEKMSLEKIMAYRMGKEERIHLGEGKIVDVFEKKTGKYLFSFELPIFAVGIAINREKLYLVTIENEPAILVYSIKF